jgi:hypothetical protein
VSTFGRVSSKILPISTDDQIADALTKPLAQNAHVRHRQYLCGG